MTSTKRTNVRVFLALLLLACLVAVSEGQDYNGRRRGLRRTGGGNRGNQGGGKRKGGGGGKGRQLGGKGGKNGKRKGRKVGGGGGKKDNGNE